MVVIYFLMMIRTEKVDFFGEKKGVNEVYFPYAYL